MKKIFLFALVLLINNIALAQDYTSYCSTNTVNKTFGGNIASISGTNLVSKLVIKNQLKKELKKQLNGNFKIDIDSFYGVNILNGEFKSLNISSPSIFYDGFYFSNLNVKTLCNYNHVAMVDKKLNFIENMLFDYSAQITQQDLDNTVKTSEFQNIINKINSNEYVSKIIKIQTTEVKLKNDKIYLNYTVEPFQNLKIDLIKKYLKPVTIAIGANLKVDDGEIQLCDLEVNNIKANYSSILPIINMLNPLSYKTQISKNKNSNIYIEKFLIDDSKITIYGKLLILKDAQS